VTAIAETTVETDTAAGPLAEIIKRVSLSLARSTRPTTTLSNGPSTPCRLPQTACCGSRRAIELLAVLSPEQSKKWRRGRSVAASLFRLAVLRAPSRFLFDEPDIEEIDAALAELRARRNGTAG
jgi:hypothetical protein